jgi:transposase
MRALPQRRRRRPADDPVVLLKIVLLAYSPGIVGSRRIEAAWREHVLFIAVSGDTPRRFERGSALGIPP